MLDFLTLIENNLLINNEYLFKYQTLIIKNKGTKKEAFTTQVHHIIPKTAFKLLDLEVDDSSANKVNLIYRDHLLAHYYLAKCSVGQLKYGNILALKHIFGHRCCEISEEELLQQLPDIQLLYEEAMQQQAINTKIAKTGKTFSDEHKARISAANKGRIYIHNETQEKLINPDSFESYQALGYVKGRLHRPSAETKARMSASMQRAHKCTDYAREVFSKKVLGSKWMHKDDIQKQILPEKVQDYLDAGWVFGKKAKKV